MSWNQPGDDLVAGALHPAGIMDVRPRLGLLAGLGAGVPAVIQQHEHRPNAVLVANRQELVDPFAESLGVLAVGNVVQIYAKDVKADSLGPGELLVDRLGIERICLPELKLVDRGSRRLVAPGQPGLGGVPLGRPLFGPSLACEGRNAQKKHHARGYDRIINVPKHRLLPAAMALEIGGSLPAPLAEGSRRHCGGSIRPCQRVCAMSRWGKRVLENVFFLRSFLLDISADTCIIG